MRLGMDWIFSQKNSDPSEAGNSSGQSPDDGREATTSWQSHDPSKARMSSGLRPDDQKNQQQGEELGGYNLNNHTSQSSTRNYPPHNNKVKEHTLAFDRFFSNNGPSAPPLSPRQPSSSSPPPPSSSFSDPPIVTKITKENNNVSQRGKEEQQVYNKTKHPSFSTRGASSISSFSSGSPFDAIDNDNDRRKIENFDKNFYIMLEKNGEIPTNNFVKSIITKHPFDYTLCYLWPKNIITSSSSSLSTATIAAPVNTLRINLKLLTDFWKDQDSKLGDITNAELGEDGIYFKIAKSNTYSSNSVSTSTALASPPSFLLTSNINNNNNNSDNDNDTPTGTTASSRDNAGKNNGSKSIKARTTQQKSQSSLISSLFIKREDTKPVRFPVEEYHETKRNGMKQKARKNQRYNDEEEKEEEEEEEYEEKDSSYPIHARKKRKFNDGNYKNDDIYMPEPSPRTKLLLEKSSFRGNGDSNRGGGSNGFKFF
jgi:hypothetical protein